MLALYFPWHKKQHRNEFSKVQRRPRFNIKIWGISGGTPSKCKDIINNLWLIKRLGVILSDLRKFKTPI